MELISGGRALLGLVADTAISSPKDRVIGFLTYNLLGLQNVYISITDGGYGNESYQMTSGSATDLLPGILCVNG